MVIRQLEKNDAGALKSCRLFGLGESPDAFLVTYAEASGTPLASVESELTDSDIRYLGAFHSDALVGFMRFVRFRRQARRHVAEVRSVYVKSAMRGQGVGSALLGRLIEEARSAGIESLILAVLADNPAARRLYESRGFQCHGIEPRAIKREGRYIDHALYSLNVVDV